MVLITWHLWDIYSVCSGHTSIPSFTEAQPPRTSRKPWAYWWQDKRLSNACSALGSPYAISHLMLDTVPWGRGATPLFYRGGNRVRGQGTDPRSHTWSQDLSPGKVDPQAEHFPPAIAGGSGPGEEAEEAGSGKRKDKRRREWDCTEDEAGMTPPMNPPKPGWIIPFHCNKQRDYSWGGGAGGQGGGAKNAAPNEREKCWWQNISETLWFMLFVFSLWLP